MHERLAARRKVAGVTDRLHILPVFTRDQRQRHRRQCPVYAVRHHHDHLLALERSEQRVRRARLRTRPAAVSSRQCRRQPAQPRRLLIPSGVTTPIPRVIMCTPPDTASSTALSTSGVTLDEWLTTRTCTVLMSDALVMSSGRLFPKCVRRRLAEVRIGLRPRLDERIEIQLRRLQMPKLRDLRGVTVRSIKPARPGRGEMAEVNADLDAISRCGRRFRRRRRRRRRCVAVSPTTPLSLSGIPRFVTPHDQRREHHQHRRRRQHRFRLFRHHRINAAADVAGWTRNSALAAAPPNAAPGRIRERRRPTRC